MLLYRPLVIAEYEAQKKMSRGGLAIITEHPFSLHSQVRMVTSAHSLLSSPLLYPRILTSNLQRHSLILSLIPLLLMAFLGTPVYIFLFVIFLSYLTLPTYFSPLSPCAFIPLHMYMAMPCVVCVCRYVKQYSLGLLCKSHLLRRWGRSVFKILRYVARPQTLIPFVNEPGPQSLFHM